jgi:hypothetical protein
LVAVSDEMNAVLAEPQHRPEQHRSLDVSAQTGQVVDGVAMVDAHHVLFDDRPFVQGFGHLMGRCANQFDAALLGAPIRCRADERRQERVMDVDQRQPT